MRDKYLPQNIMAINEKSLREFLECSSPTSPRIKSGIIRIRLLYRMYMREFQTIRNLCKRSSAKYEPRD